MFALYFLLPLFASMTLAAPTQPQRDVIEPRQHRGRPTGGRGSRVRPGATQAAATPAPAPASTPAVETPSAPVASAMSPAEAPANSAAGASSNVQAPASDPAPVATASGTTSASSGGAAAGSGPVGLGWDPAKNPASISSYVDAGLQWFTNWLPSAADYPAIEYVPMVWGSGSVPQLKEAMGGWPAGTTHVLSFNEPDMNTDGGSAMSVADGVKFHNEAVAILGDGYVIGAPAVANHPEGEQWLDDWLAACESAGGCKHDFLPIHFYGTDAQAVIDYAKKFSTKYNKPLWLTEWACHDFGSKTSCTPAEAEEFMKTIIEWCRGEGSSMVTRWAWFGAFPDMTNWNGNNMDGNRIANADGSINALGKEYMKL